VTIFAACYFCGEVTAIRYRYCDRPMCQACRDEWAPGAAITAMPAPPYEAPRLVTYGDIAALAGKGRVW
jgi:hypothetical protein